MLCAELVEVEWKDKASRRQRDVGNLEDISLAGACVQLDRPIPRGTNVVVRYRGGELQAEIQHCLSRDQSYFIGMEFPATTRWSSAEFRPQHMLDPRELTARAMKRHRQKAQTQLHLL
jgi:hypothetical protein